VKSGSEEVVGGGRGWHVTPGGERYGVDAIMTTSPMDSPDLNALWSIHFAHLPLHELTPPPVPTMEIPEPGL
jgi:hypothetical protein